MAHSDKTDNLPFLIKSIGRILLKPLRSLVFFVFLCVLRGEIGFRVLSVQAGYDAHSNSNQFE